MSKLQSPGASEACAALRAVGPMQPASEDALFAFVETLFSILSIWVGPRFAPMIKEADPDQSHKQTEQSPMAYYVDGYVIPLLKKRVDDYRQIATLAAEVWRDHGALEYRECVGEDLNVKSQIPFPQLIDAQSGRNPCVCLDHPRVTRAS
jgi:Protein of unknown function (DUF1428)